MSDALSVEDSSTPAESTAAATGKLRSLALKGSFYEILSFGTSQAIRLGGNLLLTRLLFPEAFGLNALVLIVNQGLVMLSDVGITPGVIQSPKGDDPQFLNTAWTMHAVRGVCLFLIALVLAWPMSWLYEEPALGPLLAVGSLNVLISGFESTSLMTLVRRVDARTSMMIDLSAQLVSMALTIVVALFMKSVWALIFGALVATTIRTIVSHLIDVGYKNRFAWSPEAAKTIMSFGRWILFSSAVTFAAAQADRIFLGKFLGFSELGIYTVAMTLAEAGTIVGTRLTNQVLYPIFSRVHADPTLDLRSIYYRARLALDALVLPAAGALCVFAPLLIEFLYDDRYLDAGWMLRVLVLRVAIAAVVTPSERCLLSMGHAHYTFTKNLIRALWMLAALPLGFHLFGLAGVVWVIALSELPSLVFLLWAFQRKGLLWVRRELLVPLLFGGGALLAKLIELPFRW